jgi:uncharacterized protein YukE
MSGGVEFPAEAVRQHAVAVNEAAEQMTQARAAVSEVAMDSRAYGQLCQFLPGLLSPLFDNAVDVMTEAVDALDETAAKLRSTVAAMEATDAGSARQLHDAAGPGLVLPL